MGQKKLIADTSGIRIDLYLSKSMEDVTRSYIQKLIEDKKVLVNQKTVKSNYKINENDIIEVDIPQPVELKIEAQEIDLDILYEDDDLIVINKPQGMVVHPAPGNYSGTLVNALLKKCTNLSGINGVLRPGIVHRIDKDTSGVLLAAKNDLAHKSLAAQIKDHTVNRRYIAMVEGVIKNDSGIIEGSIGRHARDRKKMDVIKGGKPAITHFKVLDRYNGYTLIEAKLETGRTHQIRVHMSHIGYPVVGDPVYGYKNQKFNLKGQALHAYILGFNHPRSGVYMEFAAPLPEYFNELIEKIKMK
ncbi:ribosomal large subunit pseudouridine synthase D [Oxobacter pfennigii]|uniref:Pseudouridine synthase n=1 Tax=Oxobacter pfennigii TaxID=36849 RepID=A0A0P9AF54_9CLOT|nr:RluA family pseudouridine synthase [Oxobacter pfennigii]KPU43991.1 ribosomal large subunit pseudouridine synthase D [Oxobacter pfennigii]